MGIGEWAGLEVGDWIHAAQRARPVAGLVSTRRPVVNLAVSRGVKPGPEDVQAVVRYGLVLEEPDDAVWRWVSEAQPRTSR